jgi:hypothetical protein
MHVASSLYLNPIWIQQGWLEEVDEDSPVCNFQKSGFTACIARVKVFSSQWDRSLYLCCDIRAWCCDPSLTFVGINMISGYVVFLNILQNLCLQLILILQSYSCLHRVCHFCHISLLEQRNETDSTYSHSPASETNPFSGVISCLSTSGFFQIITMACELSFTHFQAILQFFLVWGYG